MMPSAMASSTETHLVTGGAGFLGAALVHELLAAGHSVRVFDDLSRGAPHRLPDAIEAITGDIRDPTAVHAAAAACHTLWHLAWINGTRHFYDRPDTVLEVGLRGTLNTIDAAIAHGIRRYVFVSTSEVYNTPTHIPTDETERLLIPDVKNPRFSYGGGKIAGELLTLHLAAHRGLQTIIVRPHNIYGPDMGADHVIPEAIARIIDLSDNLRRPAIDLPMQGDGRETRAFCHIRDAATGLSLAGQQGTPGEIYHLGRPEETPIADLMHAIGACLGIKLTLRPGPLPPGGTPRRCPDITRLMALGYHPRISLTDGLTETVKWYRDHILTHRSPTLS